MKFLCKLGLHSWHTAPNGMLRWCPNCNSWEVNSNLNADPIKCWREISVEDKDKLVDDWHKAGKLL